MEHSETIQTTRAEIVKPKLEHLGIQTDYVAPLKEVEVQIKVEKEIVYVPQEIPKPSSSAIETQTMNTAEPETKKDYMDELIRLRLADSYIRKRLDEVNLHTKK